MSADAYGTNDVFVLGLDGVPWDFVERWGTDGTLPNVTRLLEEGAGGPLQSTLPHSTPLAWPSIATGTDPDQHGIYSFQRVTSAYTHEMYTNEDLEGQTLWDLLTPAVVGNVPMTYPAAEIDGTMVTGMLSPGTNERFTHPSELSAEIERDMPDYEIGLTWAEYVDRKDDLRADISTLLESRRQLMRRLMDEEWRLFFFTYTAPDRLQHLCWDEDALLEHYRELDEIVGEVLEYVETHEAILLVVSDHGFGPVSKNVAANRVLEDHGYLQRKGGEDGRSLLDSVGVTKDNVGRAFDAVGVNHHHLIRRYVPRSLTDFLASTVPGDHFLYDLDHGRTKAFVHEVGNVYVNDTERFDEGAVDPADVDALKGELTTLFTGLRDPDTGDRLLDVHDGADCFPRDSRSPDLVLEPREGYGVSFSLADESIVTPSADADHERTGILLAWGEDVAAGTRLEDPHVVDVAPTVLHAAGEPIPTAVDGRVLEELFEPGSEPAERSVETAAYDSTDGDGETDDDFGEVKERLQGLGYVE